MLRFNLHQREYDLFPDELIDLVSMGVTKKIDLWPDFLNERVFHDVPDYDIFVQASAKLNQGEEITLDVCLKIAVEKPERLQFFFVKPEEESAMDQIESVPNRIVEMEYMKAERKRPA